VNHLLDQPPDGRERRKTFDRREGNTPFLSRFWLRGKRRGGRRRSDRPEGYVDRYRAGEWGLAVAVMALSMSDLILTLVYLSLGGEERNPIMDSLLQHSRGLFIGVKVAVSGLGALFLLVHVRFRNVRKGLIVIVVLYMLLIIYHLVTWVPAVLGGK
jgi:hypothetical protein